MVKMMISNGGGGGNSRCVPAPFLTKTYELVEDPSTDDVISWSEKGNTFVVWKSAEFARDLLPKYFKHNNFSSFVRQLNTYGFRKIVPDKWEFQNEGFKRGEKELLCEINRRKSVHASTVRIIPNGKGSGPSHSNSGDEMGTSSMSDTKNNASDETTEITTMNATQMSNLPDENEKLRKDNQLLTSELARTKKQCEDLTVFLSKYINVAPVQINHVMLHGGVGGLGPKPILENKVPHIDDGDDDENEGECLKLFGVMLKGKKRGRDEGNCGLPSVKVMDYRAPSMKISSSQGGSSKICN